ncbi:hypothetical protein EON67_11240 [archaeon]|nr:MAG: hypothetical protein EON67_11240 [archaeon]
MHECACVRVGGWASAEFAPDVSDIAKSVMRPHVWSHMLAGRTFPYAPPWNPAHISYRRVFELCDQNAAFHEVLSQNPDAVNAQLAEVVRRWVTHVPHVHAGKRLCWVPVRAHVSLTYACA